MIRQVDDILSLQAFTDQIGSKSNYLVQEYSGELYHYTDLNALIGIIGNHDLWLTNSRFSNDENELNHGYDIARKVIKEKKEASNDSVFRKYCDRVDSLLNEPPQGVYICCFCERNNLLSQWRSYGENGSGVSIGFDPVGFTRFTGPDLPLDEFGLMRLWKVYYDDLIKQNIVEQALEIIPEMHPGETEEYKAQKAAEAIHFFLPTFKNKDFEEEDERRLIFTPSKNCQVKPTYRFKRQMLVPYFSLNSIVKSNYTQVEKLPVNRITVGPGVRKQINKESIEMLVHNNGYENVIVDVSETPYRG